MHWVSDYRKEAKEAEDSLEDFLDELRDAGQNEEQLEAAKIQWLEDNEDLANAISDGVKLLEFSEDSETIPEHKWKDHVYDTIQELKPAELDLSQWPWNCLDYEQAANDLSSDYTLVELSDGDYYVRN